MACINKDMHVILLFRYSLCYLHTWC